MMRALCDGGAAAHLVSQLDRRAVSLVRKAAARGATLAEAMRAIGAEANEQEFARAIEKRFGLTFTGKAL